jgi:hypothetical protein
VAFFRILRGLVRSPEPDLGEVQAEAVRFGVGLDLLGPYLDEGVTIGGALERSELPGSMPRQRPSRRCCPRWWSTATSDSSPMSGHCSLSDLVPRVVSRMKPRSARNGSCGFGLGWIALGVPGRRARRARRGR